MCLRISRTPLVALIIGVYLELSIRNGNCDDGQISAKAQYGTEESESLPHRHVQSWNGWEDWMSTSASGSQQHYEMSHQHPAQQYVPLSSTQQAKLRGQRSRNDRNTSKAKSSHVKSSKNSTDKTGHEHNDEGDLTMADLKSLKDAAVNLASTVANNFMKSWSFSSTSKNEIDSQIPRNGRAIYLDNLDRPDGPNFGMPETESKRGVIDWVSRLIGVQGKTLGEFLREYQVHVLYDLAFTFFKWIFFLYAGLLIP